MDIYSGDLSVFHYDKGNVEKERQKSPSGLWFCWTNKLKFGYIYPASGVGFWP